jgi:hypothetical protein
MTPRITTILSAALLTAACAPNPTPTESFDSLWDAFDERYGGFHQRGIDWDALGDAHRARVHDDMSDEELAVVMQDMLTPLDDGHVRLIRPDQVSWPSNRVYRERIDDDLFDLDLILDNLDEGWSRSEDGEGYVYGTLCGTRYVHFGYTADQLMVIDRVLDGGTEPLIIDARHMGGGDSTWALAAIERLTAERVDVFRVRTRNGPDRHDYTDRSTWDLRPRGEHDDRPIVVLTDRYTISAAERMVLALRELPQVTTMGVPTNGAQATVITHVLENGWIAMVPVQEVEGLDGAVYEGPGIPPDIEIQTTREELDQGYDAVLDAAIEQLNPGADCLDRPTD